MLVCCSVSTDLSELLVRWMGCSGFSSSEIIFLVLKYHKATEDIM